MAHNLWMHYLYSGDTVYLRDKIYPIIKDYALFYASFIENCRLDNGKVVFGPSVDPEHTAFGWDNSPYDLAWSRHTPKAAIQGANDLGVDSDLVKRWSDSLSELIGGSQRICSTMNGQQVICPEPEGTLNRLSR